MNRTLGNPLVVLDSVDSTNNYAMLMVREGLAQNGSAYFAMEQTSGKGQRGRLWQSPKGENLLLSTVIQPLDMGLAEPVQLSIAVALACYDLVKMYLGAEDCKIKWPNDLYWHDRKTGGILIESIWKANTGTEMAKNKNSRWSWAIIGTGINLNQTEFPGMGKKAVSFLQVTGKKSDPLKVCRQLLELLEYRIGKMQSDGFEKELASYNDVLYKKGECVEFVFREKELATIVRGVDKDGRLITDAGDFEWGSLQWNKM
jgi:BirA family biotin operon repressor/biotin-[acetyl-CoA-carboxylase] ligase